MNEEIFRITKDLERTRDLFEMAQERLNEIISILPKEKYYKIIEEYYETIIQLITALMYSDGYKTLNHVSLIDYLSNNYKEFNYNELKLIDALRKFRHGTVYYGKKIGSEFLVNHEEEIVKVINKLSKILKEKLNISDNFLGVIIEESLENKSVLKKVKIIKTEIENVTEEHKTPWIKQWTLYTIEISENKANIIAEEISKSLDSQHDWYADFKNNEFHYIIFRNKTFKINRLRKEEYEEVTKYGISLGIPSYQLDFSPHLKEWER